MDTTLVYGTGNRLEPMQTRTARVSRFESCIFGALRGPQTGKSAQNARVLPLHTGGKGGSLGMASITAMVEMDAIVAGTPNPSTGVEDALRQIGEAAGCGRR